MALPPHLHLLLPSSDPSILLEARLYLPLPLDKASQDGILPISREVRSSPVRFSALTPTLRSAIAKLGLERLVVAAHPWAKLGGSMLDPVISQHLLSAVIEAPNEAPGKGKTAVLSFNVRGCGHSEGSAPLLTIGHEADDFAAIEKEGLRLCGRDGQVETWRFAYSWGCTAALSALPPPSGVRGVFLVSPAFGVTRALGWITTNTAAALKAYLATLSASSEGNDPGSRDRVHMVFGDGDQFTGVGTFRSISQEHQGKALKGIEVERADHFWRDDPAGERLETAIKDWLAT